MIVDEQHAALHNAAQDVCMAVSDDLYYSDLPPAVQATLARLAVVCGCTHQEWWSADACALDDPDGVTPAAMQQYWEEQERQLALCKEAIRGLLRILDYGTPIPGRERTWYSLDPEQGMTLHGSADDAEEHAARDLDYHRDAAKGGEWHEDIDALCWGETVRHGETRCIERRVAPKSSGVDEYEDWSLIRLPIASREVTVEDTAVLGLARELVER